MSEHGVPIPPPKERNTRVIVAICVAAVLGSIGLAWFAMRLGLVQLGRPGFVIEKAWYTDGGVYVDVRNTGWGTAHNFKFSAGLGRFLNLGPYGSRNIPPGGKFHMTLSGARKHDVHYVIVSYDEGKDTFIIPWSNRESSDYETLTNIQPETATPQYSLTSR